MIGRSEKKTIVRLNHEAQNGEDMSQIDPRFFKPFIEGTLNTMKIQCGLSATGKPPFIKGGESYMDTAIAGVIGITSEKFTGSITLCFPEQVFLGMMERMLGEAFPEITPDLQDGVAELLNIIYGQAKVVLNSNGHSIQKAIPTVIRGDKIQTSALSKNKTFVLPFSSEIGDFSIEICAEASL